jgi:hypothetical protein
MTKSTLKTSTAIAVAVNVEYAIDAVLIAQGKAFLAADKTLQDAASSRKNRGPRNGRNALQSRMACQRY